MVIEVPVSIGECVDKMSILELKTQRITDEKKRTHAQKEFEVLKECLRRHQLEEAIQPFYVRLFEVNSKLWEIEDQIRLKEKAQNFDETFVELARQVYHTNDQRFAIKNQLNEVLGSGLVEVKSYEKYD